MPQLIPSKFDSNRKMPSDGDDRQVLRKIRATTLRLFLGTIIATFIATMITTWAAAGIAFVLGIALASTGFVIGLLFSMPRALAVASDIYDGTVVKSEIAGPKSSLMKPSRPIYSVNTNLEQVSDWLTKIIVGVGLFEAQHLSKVIRELAITLGHEFHKAQPSLDAESATGIAEGMIIAFPLLGFLIGFFSVRLYISRALYAADADVLRPIAFTYSPSTRGAVDEAWTATAVPGASRPSPNLVSPAIDAVLSAPLDQLQSISDLITWT